MKSQIFSLKIGSLIKSDKFQEFMRFGIVGVLATIIHYGIYLMLLSIMNENIAYSIGYAISFIANFFASNYFTFKTKPNVKKGLGFGLSHVINYCLHICLLNLFIIIGIKEKLAPIPVFIIAIPVNFIMVRFFLKK